MSARNGRFLSSFFVALRSIDDDPDQAERIARNEERAYQAKLRLGERFVCATPMQRPPVRKGVLS